MSRHGVWIPTREDIADQEKLKSARIHIIGKEDPVCLDYHSIDYQYPMVRFVRDDNTVLWLNVTQFTYVQRVDV